MTIQALTENQAREEGPRFDSVAEKVDELIGVVERFLAYEKESGFSH